MVAEITSRQNYLPTAEVHTLYLGGGTPSMLSINDLERLFDAVHHSYIISGDAEITIECNPEDVTPERIRQWRQLGINRVSVGVQSLDDALLRWMGRQHSAEQAHRAVADLADAGFNNISIDLIFGVRGLSTDRWRQMLETVVQWPIRHISCYDLTIEGRNLWAHRTRKFGETFTVSDATAAEQFLAAHHILEAHGFGHYEISNYAIPGFESRHNRIYWEGTPYWGVGPSAHSYDGARRRRRNIANNARYVRAVTTGTPYFTEEILSEADQFNELILTRLRTRRGLRHEELRRFPHSFHRHLQRRAVPWRRTGHLEKTPHGWRLTLEGMLLADRIIADLMVE